MSVGTLHMCTNADAAVRKMARIVRIWSEVGTRRDILKCRRHALVPPNLIDDGFETTRSGKLWYPISFKVGPLDGIFGFDMVPSEPQGTTNLHPPSGLKLVLRAASDSNGVTTLTLSTSGESHSASNERASEYIFGDQSNGNVLSSVYTDPFDRDFSRYCEERRTSGPLMLDCDRSNALDHLFFQGLDTDNPLYCEDEQRTSGPSIPILDLFPSETMETRNIYCDGSSTLDLLSDSGCPHSYKIGIFSPACNTEHIQLFPLQLSTAQIALFEIPAFRTTLFPILYRYTYITKTAEKVWREVYAGFPVHDGLHTGFLAEARPDAT
ncbi:hypothetical protein DFH07DRAFT_1025556 [Mycena maculata]|uniref:Uncharacterized protein n=1 Tax=Mycena maculata TaxID=230809 RepID=A0AAD7J4Z4_9AGAR|nr:hypothetical protein DFH07DRAFT_1025556 [Mycena maculata]